MEEEREAGSLSVCTVTREAVDDVDKGDVFRSAIMAAAEAGWPVVRVWKVEVAVERAEAHTDCGRSAVTLRKCRRHRRPTTSERVRNSRRELHEALHRELTGVKVQPQDLAFDMGKGCSVRDLSTEVNKNR